MAENVVDPPDDLIAGANCLLAPGLAAEVINDDGTVVVRLKGELDMASAPRLDLVLSSTLATSPSRIVLDLSELTFVDSTGLHVFVAASRRASRVGCAFILRSPRPNVLKTLRLTGIDGLVTIDIGDTAL